MKNMQKTNFIIATVITLCAVLLVVLMLSMVEQAPANQQQNSSTVATSGVSSQKEEISIAEDIPADVDKISYTYEKKEYDLNTLANTLKKPALVTKTVKYKSGKEEKSDVYVTFSSVAKEVSTKMLNGQETIVIPRKQG